MNRLRMNENKQKKGWFKHLHRNPVNVRVNGKKHLDSRRHCKDKKQEYVVFSIDKYLAIHTR